MCVCVCAPTFAALHRSDLKQMHLKLQLFGESILIIEFVRFDSQKEFEELDKETVRSEYHV